MMSLSLLSKEEWANRCLNDGEFRLASRHWDGGVRFNLPATEGDVREPAWSPRKKKIFTPIAETDLKSGDEME